MLVRQARRAGLLASLRHKLGDSLLPTDIPQRPLRHLDGDQAVAARHAQQVRWEVGRIGRALTEAGIPVVLLKGAAYLLSCLPTCRGRVFSDIDILVPRGALATAEKLLLRHGWRSTSPDAYDQRYYRDWMHEIPPLQHVARKSVLDVHHTILPPTSKAKPEARKLLAAAVPVAGYEDLYVLAPTDMVLHSATHLFYDGELNHGLRDLVDLDDLLKHFGETQVGFWPALVARAFEMQLAQPLHYALRYANRILGTKVPAEIDYALRDAGPNRLMRPVMDALFDRALLPDHATCSDWFTPAARWLLYVRAHHLRMPMRLLVPHLARKAWRRVKGEEDKRG
jgi:hypothetical protein